MPPAYVAIRNRVVTAVDARLGETVAFRPMQKGAADPARPPLDDVSGVLRTGVDVAQSVQGSVRSGKARAQIAGATARLALDRSRYSDLEIREGDDFRAIDREGQPWFEVLFVDRENHSRIYVYLGDAGC